MLAHHSLDGKLLLHDDLLLFDILRFIGMTSGNGSFRIRDGPVLRTGAPVRIDGYGGSLLGSARLGSERCRLPTAQAQRIRDHAYRAARHGRCRDHGVQHHAREGEHSRRHRDADDVVNERPEQVLFDVAQRRPRKRDGRRHVGKVAFHEYDVGRFDGDVGTGADSDAHIRACERGRIVHAVADHGNRSLFLQVADDFFFSLRQHACDYLVGADALLNGPCRAVVVAREHDRANPHAGKLGESSGASRLRFVGQGDHSGKGSVNGEVEHGFTLVGKTFRLVFRRRDVDSALLHEPGVACKALTPCDPPADAAAGNLLETLDFLHLDPARLGIRHDRLRERMLRTLLEGIREGEEGGCGVVEVRGRDGFGGAQPLGSPGSRGTCFTSTAEAAFDNPYVAHLGRALRDGARLVEHDRLHAMGSLERLGGLHENAVCGAASRSHHDGGRRGKTERAGA